MASEKFEISCKTGESFYMELPSPSTNESFFAFSMHKAGSTLMEKVLTDYCKVRSIPVVSPHASAWLNSVSTGAIGKDLEKVFRVKGYAYLGFRHYLTFETDFDMGKVKKILLIRDPRDMLTSLYFSRKYSHNVPKKEGSAKTGIIEGRDSASQQDIDSFVVEKADFYVRQFGIYKQRLISLPNTRVYRYEDIIFEKVEWLKDMLSFLGDELPDRTIRQIVSPHDIIPAKEDPKSHVRQVTPGNFRKHLSEKAIETLNRKLNAALTAFGYE